MDKLQLKAYGKINLGLDVIRKRPDGYHDLDMIMQMVDVYDDVIIEKKAGEEIVVKADAAVLSNGKDNLAYMAAKMLFDEFGIKSGVEITIHKRIPIAGGMAGGSSDCATTLIGINEMFNLGLSKQQLMGRGVKLGADVPYCIMRGTVLAEGIGEELSVLPAMPKCTVLIAKPPVSVSTKVVYEALDSEEIIEHPDIDALIEGLRQKDLHRISENMGNVLEDVTIPMHPVIEELKQVMRENGAIGAMMSGSGPTVFGLFENRAAAREAQRKIRESGLTKQVYVTNVHNVRRK